MKLHHMWQDYPDLAKQLTTTLQLMEDVVKLKNKKVLNWKLRTFSYINFGFLNRLENELK